MTVFELGHLSPPSDRGWNLHHRLSCFSELWTWTGPIPLTLLGLQLTDLRTSQIPYLYEPIPYNNYIHAIHPIGLILFLWWIPINTMSQMYKNQFNTNKTKWKVHFGLCDSPHRAMKLSSAKISYTLVFSKIVNEKLAMSELAVHSSHFSCLSQTHPINSPQHKILLTVNPPQPKEELMSHK